MMELLNTKNTKKILVIGDIILDEYIKGEVERISPEAPIPVFMKKNSYCSLGGAANVALNLKQIGIIPTLIGVAGNDNASVKLIQLLKSSEISREEILIDEDRCTTIKTRLIAQGNHQLLRIDQEIRKIISTDIERRILDRIKGIISEVDAIIISDYNKGVITKNLCNEVIAVGKQHNKKVLVDVKGTNCDKYCNAFLIKPNLKELQDLTGLAINSDNDVIKAGKELLNTTGAEYILITKGAGGMTLVSENDLQYNIPSIVKDVYDVTGAGDTAIAFLAAGLANNIRIEECAELANTAAGLKVSKFGTVPVSIEEVLCHYDKKDISKSEKLITLDMLSDLQFSEAKIVFTNGCFDIIHAGHVEYLRQAKALGDVLIVGVNADNSVKKLKGQNRPIYPLEDRISILSAIEYIDYLIIFEEETPFNLIKAIKPDILVKGGDYADKEIVGQDIVAEYGGEVQLIKFLENRSTTRVIEKIKKGGAEGEY
ncbi:D-glycero-beta-D-manno-heptose-7-phosphate kinase [Macellibacteroides fermentans]|uniref:D-glycero-beta-D-manno-heptose-7-phosphate kinase n=1 Tax=Macellibacteroides fermentans TaxID=879969 RepID=UPI00406CD63A